MKLPPPIVALAILLMASPAAAAPALVKMTAAVQARYGVRTAPLAAGAAAGAALIGYARVLDTGPLAALEAEIVAAQAALDASQAEAARTRALHAADEAVAAKVAEAAQAQARADAARLALARRRLGLEWGPAVARLGDAARAALINNLAAGRSALLRIDTPSGQGLPAARSAMLDRGPGQAPVRATVLGPARAAEARLQSGGVVAVVSGPAAAWLSNGLMMQARFELGAARSGVVIPRAALIRWRGGAWAYVRRGPDRFERVAADGVPIADGMFVGGGFVPGDPVVVDGAGAVFALEQASAAGE